MAPCENVKLLILCIIGERMGKITMLLITDSRMGKKGTGLTLEANEPLEYNGHVSSSCEAVLVSNE